MDPARQHKESEEKEVEMQAVWVDVVETVEKSVCHLSYLHTHTHT